ncbi:MAG: site-specific DNA-methyltransferase [Phycisphaerales bacterium]|nr:site-specific DNA-methyltransferase [Phycisphaerales bacterium]
MSMNDNEEITGHRASPAMELDRIETTDALTGLRRLPAESIDCMITSPPYWAQRNYGGTPLTWPDGRTGSLGLEPEFDQYLDHLVSIFDEAHRVLKPSGTLWVNLGDCYAGSWSIGPAHGGHAGRHAQPGMVPGWNHHANPRRSVMPLAKLPVPNKCLCLVPERFALRMVARSWTLRNRIVWHKPNFLPARVKDRFACSWEYLFLFTKSERYWFDLDAVRVPHASIRGATTPWRTFREGPRRARAVADTTVGRRELNPKGKNPGDCWVIPTHGSRRYAHPAAFPEALLERPIKSGCPPGGVVLDPFMGSGTTAVVARRLGRRFIGFEANAEFAALARRRIAETRPVQPLEGDRGVAAAA